jgi:hypothetical protein
MFYFKVKKHVVTVDQFQNIHKKNMNFQSSMILVSKAENYIYITMF